MILKHLLIVIASILFFFGNSIEGAPSSVFWTNCTTQIYETGVGHFDADNYFTLFRGGRRSNLPTNVAFEAGVFSWRDLKAEAGIDLTAGTSNPIWLNFGVGIEEGKLFCHAPSFKIGIFSVGTRVSGHRPTNQNVADFIIGKELPEKIGGTFYVGGYSGARALGKNKQGFMLAYQRYFCKEKYCDKRDYYKWCFCADYASGNNAIGGGGFAIGYFFTPDIDIITGPVWFNSAKINGTWKWAIQIDINFSLFDAKKSD